MRPKLLTVLLLLLAINVFGRPQLHDLDIQVVLMKNGDALITERRQMTIDSEGTECYIGLANMGPSIVKGLSVTDVLLRLSADTSCAGDWAIVVREHTSLNIP